MREEATCGVVAAQTASTTLFACFSTFLSVLTSQAVKMIEHPRIAIAIPDFINLHFFMLLFLYDSSILI